MAKPAMMTKPASRIRRIATVAGATIVGASAALAALAPTAAQAADPIGWGGTLQSSQSHCFSRYADSSVYQVRAEGTATGTGARFRFLRNGVVLDATPVDTARTFAAERRSAYGNYPGSGTYTICAANHHATSTLVNLRILFNNQFI
jgi:hypothetical protein